MPKRSSGNFTEKELAFVRNYSGNQTEAARKAGYKNPEQIAVRLMKRKEIRDAIDARMAAERNESAAQLAKRVTVTRSEIINGLHAEAKEAESDSARVSAWRVLAEIFKLTKPTGEDFEGWTDEELKAYVEHGTLPAWYGPFGPEEEDNASHGSAPGEPTHGDRSMGKPGEGAKDPSAPPVRPAKSTRRPN